MAQFAFEMAYSPREAKGKCPNRRLRSQEQQVPAVVYGGGIPAECISINQLSLSKALKHEAFYSHILTLSHQDKKQKVVLKAIQRHPYKPRILHLDFLRIDPKKPLIMHVPLHFLGEDKAPGLVQGGIFTHHKVELEVKCLPHDLPEYIAVDVSEASLGTVVRLSQVSLPEGVTLTHMIKGPEEDLPVISLQKPRPVSDTSASEAPSEEASTHDDAPAKKE